MLVTDETDKDVPMNIMYADAVFKALPTTWLYMKYSDDDGKTWNKSQEVEISQLEYKSGERTVGKDDSSIPVSEQSFYGRGVIQPTLWESNPDQVHMLLRSTE